MKVKDLIILLQTKDPQAVVVIDGYEDGCDFVKSVDDVLLVLNQFNESWYGKHEINNENGNVVAVHIK
jgi:hypothetical protein